jgi:Dual-action HEIGH metallo-peptidase
MKAPWQRIAIALGGLWLAACSAGGGEELGSIPSWESYREAATREFEGRTFYLLDGDIAVTLDELRVEYDRLVAWIVSGEIEREHGVGRTQQRSTVNQVGGVDDLWSTSDRRDLTYCVSDEFAAQHGQAVAEMAQATADWERSGNVNFRYVPGEDDDCDNGNTNIVFSVRPWDDNGACAFFPSGGGCVPRTVVMNFDAFAVGPVTSQGVFRHELGHVLGLRHEHIRFPGTNCTELSAWRAVTPYDSASVMHYPWCPGGTNAGDLFITPDDAAGIESLYGPSTAHGFAYVTSPGNASATYSFNSEGGTVTAAAGAAGSYTVTFGGLGGTGGNVQVVSYGASNTRCKVSSWGGSWPGDLTVNVRCHLPDGTAQASAFVVQYARKNTTSDGTGAYLWASQQASASYCASSTYSWNSTDGVNCITRSAAGNYAALLPGLAVSGGTVQVTAYGSAGEHCKVQSWGPSGADQQVRVRCFNAAGAAADSRFTLNFFGDDEVSAFDYGGYAWANDQTNALYTPSLTYSYGSECQNEVVDIEAGKIDATPGHYFLWYDALSPTSSAVHVTAYGTTSSYCKVQGWSASDGGTEVRSQCYAADGTAENSRYVGTYATSLVRDPC